jgi:hypothetical protein
VRSCAPPVEGAHGLALRSELADEMALGVYGDIALVDVSNDADSD